MIRADWWRDFFQGVSVDLWLNAAGPALTAPEVDFLWKALRLEPGQRVLDIPCGGGRHAVELAKRGCRITGVDISDDFLKAARAAAATAGLAVDWRRQPMQEIAFREEFDAAFCFGNSFGYLEDADTVRFLRGVATALKPGGRFALDTGVAAESILPNFKANAWYEVGDIRFLIRNTYNHALGRLETEYTFIRDGKVETRAGFQRVHAYRELCRLLTEAGFRDCEGFSGTEMQPYQLGSQGLLLTAVRA